MIGLGRIDSIVLCFIAEIKVKAAKGSNIALKNVVSGETIQAKDFTAFSMPPVELEILVNLEQKSSPNKMVLLFTFSTLTYQDNICC